VRQYLLDVFHNPNSLLDASDAVNYVKYNFQEAARDARSAWDDRRGVKRIGIGGVALSQLPTFNLESDMVEVKIDKMWPLISSDQAFASWFHTNFISPVIAEEDRILGHSSTHLVHTGTGIHSYFDRMAGTFRFKVWEVVHFPDAKAVPLRFPPSPDEINPPKRKLE
jgi:hypothetical protein